MIWAFMRRKRIRQREQGQNDKTSMAAYYHLYEGLGRHATVRCTRNQRLTSLVCLINVVEVEDFRVPVPHC